MKLSEAILKGMERFPEQAIGAYQRGQNAACALGCAAWAAVGSARKWGKAVDVDFDFVVGAGEFLDYYGVCISQVNDRSVLREEIVGMLQHIGH